MTSENNGDEEKDAVPPPSVPGYGPPPVVAGPGGPEPAIYGIPPQWHPEPEPDEDSDREDTEADEDSEPDEDARG